MSANNKEENIENSQKVDEESKLESAKSADNNQGEKGKEKTIEEKIESFIKSNTTKKELDGKMTIAEFTKLFSTVAQKMHNESNKNVVDMLPTKKAQNG